MRRFARRRHARYIGMVRFEFAGMLVRLPADKPEVAHCMLAVWAVGVGLLSSESAVAHLAGESTRESVAELARALDRSMNAEVLV